MKELYIHPYKFVLERITHALYCVHISKTKTVYFEHLHGYRTFDFPIAVEYINQGVPWLFEGEKPLTYREFYDWCYKWAQEQEKEVKV